MPRFSERMGIVKVEVQIDSMNEKLRNSIWNLVNDLIAYDSGYGHVPHFQAIAADVLRVPKGWVPYGDPATWIFQECSNRLPWAGWYDLLEYAVGRAGSFSSRTITSEQARMTANRILEREHSGYRFVAGELTPITSPAEIGEVECATEKASASGLDGVRSHIAQALALFGKRPAPDYRNAIKEAISAVESAAKVISGNEKATLDDALKAVGKASPTHPAMIDAFRKLYGFTSDEKGIRHALLEQDARVGAEDARFFIVACSAFVNLLIIKADKAGLLKPT